MQYFLTSFCDSFWQFQPIFIYKQKVLLTLYRLCKVGKLHRLLQCTVIQFWMFLNPISLFAQPKTSTFTIIFCNKDFRFDTLLIFLCQLVVMGRASNEYKYWYPKYELGLLFEHSSSIKPEHKQGRASAQTPKLKPASTIKNTEYLASMCLDPLYQLVVPFENIWLSEKSNYACIFLLQTN